MSTYINEKRVYIMMNGKRYSIRHKRQETNNEDKIEIRYVSLGDSIAVGHSINSNWETDYGWHTQYGENNNASTTIVPNSYTDLVRKKLVSIYGDGKVIATSYAHSGDTNVNLRDKLEHKAVQESIQKAKLVTISIGANTILGPATKEIPNFIANGNPALVQIDNDLESGFNLLGSDAETYGSYRNIMTKLQELNTNPSTKFIFTTVYNPYKFLWVDESTDGNDYIDGYFGPLMWVVPNVEIDIPFVGQMDVRKFVYESAYLKDVSERINDPAGNGSYSLAQWVEGKIERLNGILKEAVLSFGDSRFAVADTKRLYDSYPDRHIREDYNYSDMVNVEIVKGQTIEDLDWGRFWDNWNIDSLSTIVKDIAMTVVEEVILPDTDPHPEEDGQYALYRSFADVLGWESTKRYTITYNANGGSGSAFTQEVFTIGHDRHGRNLVAYPTLEANMFTPSTGYYFTGWNTKEDGSGTSYTVGQAVGITGNLNLYAQWSNIYKVTIKHSQGDVIQFDSSQTGPMECYKLWIDGQPILDTDYNTGMLGAFSNPPKVLYLPYGAQIGVIAQTKSGDGRSYITLNGTKVNGNSKDARYTFTLTSDMTINYEWNQWLSGIIMQSYWNCYVTTY